MTHKTIASPPPPPDGETRISQKPIAAAAHFAAAASARPPAVPLVTHDPYFSIWSCADRLTDDDTRHWTGRSHVLTSLIRIDGVTYRLMGAAPADLPCLGQVDVQARPTRTIYEFECRAVTVTLTFTTPALPEDLDVLSRPVTYITWDVRVTDGQPHAVALYFDSSAHLAVNSGDQSVEWGREKTADLMILRLGSAEQKVLQTRGDDVRIDWGYLYSAAVETQSSSAIGPAADCLQEFAKSGGLPAADDTRMPRAAQDETPVCAFAFDLGTITPDAEPVSRHLLLAYDDLYSILYFRQDLRPYWRRSGAEAADLLQTAECDYARVQDRCRALDAELMTDLTRIGGEKYAWLAALAYRQCFAAHKLVADANGQPLYFSKENFSNGCIATVDVLYPASPQLLLFSPALLEASLVPILDYAASPRWKWPYAPHDVGVYPGANGQVYGGGERTEEKQMPVEESGNMLLMVAALARCRGDADFAGTYWPLLSQWAEYLASRGFDPENQLSTDDFTGHLAHNVNLSAKAILALGAYSQLCTLRGEDADARRYRRLAEEFAARWRSAADDGDHFRLAFDKPGTWSQKYNLVWDSILGLSLFPASVARTEVDFYRTKLNRFGLPLDCRDEATKLDWMVWTAALTGARDDFDALVSPVYDFLNATPDRVPMADWFKTTEPRMRAMQARSVVGGVFVPLLGDSGLWRKWSGRGGDNVAGLRAPLPPAPSILDALPDGRAVADFPQFGLWRYTTEPPGDGWPGAHFDDSGWHTGPAESGSKDTLETITRRTWDALDIWLRATFTVPAGENHGLALFACHDNEADIYLNGVPAVNLSGYSAGYEEQILTGESRAALLPGSNCIAVHCRQAFIGQHVDIRLVRHVGQVPQDHDAPCGGGNNGGAVVRSVPTAGPTT